jgi:hypothetical protein
MEIGKLSNFITLQVGFLRFLRVRFKAESAGFELRKKNHL